MSTFISRLASQKPQTFSELFANFSMIAPSNETVLKLMRDVNAQIDLIQELGKRKPEKVY